MNQGLELRTMRTAETGEFSERWWRETKRMVNRGYARLVREGRITPEPTMREQIAADVREREQRRDHGMQPRILI